MTEGSRGLPAFRLLAVCFSTASLLFASQIAASTDPANRFYSHWQRSDAAALAAVVLLATAAAFGLARLVQARGGPAARRILRWLFVLVLADAALGFVVRLEDKPATWLRWGVPAVALAAVAAALYLAERKTWRLAVNAALLFSPLGLILLGQLLLAPPVDVRPLVRTAEAAAPAGTPRPPIVLVIFDDWSWFRSSRDGAFLGSLPNLRALSATSFLFTEARSPGPHTVESIPELIAESQPPRLAALPDHAWWVGDGPTAARAPEPRLFTEASRAGYVPRLIGFYLPYRELVGEAVPEVHSEPHVPKGESLPAKMAFAVARSMEAMGEPVSRRVGRWFDERAYNRHWYVMNTRIRERAMESLAELEPGTFLLVHFGLPHAPFVFSAEGAYQPDSVVERMEGSLPKYHEHIRYVDRLTGEMVAVLRERGMFDEAMLVIMSDHNWVSEPDRRLREQRTVVPLVIKWPGQREGATVSTRTCLVGLQALLGRVESGALAGMPAGVPSAAAMDSLARESCA